MGGYFIHSSDTVVVSCALLRLHVKYVITAYDTLKCSGEAGRRRGGQKRHLLSFVRRFVHCHWSALKFCATMDYQCIVIYTIVRIAPPICSAQSTSTMCLSASCLCTSELAAAATAADRSEKGCLDWIKIQIKRYAMDQEGEKCKEEICAI